MQVTQKVKKILSYYDSDNIGTKTNICRILMSGKLAGTGKMVMLPVDQGFEHGPARSFGINPASYDPDYHIKLAVDAGLNAYAAPIGMVEASANKFVGQIPIILKVNSSNSLTKKDSIPDQAITSTPRDAIRLGCAAIGFTIYPGSEAAFDMVSTIREMAEEAKALGLAVVVWSYPRGGDLTKDGETAIDVCAYAAHIAALIGAHIIKVKPPTSFIYQDEAKKVYEKENIKVKDLADRIEHVVQSCFNGKRLVVFSGGASKSLDNVYNEARAIRDGGGNGSIIGRNSFQRPREEALEMLKKLINIYLGKE